MELGKKIIITPDVFTCDQLMVGNVSNTINLGVPSFPRFPLVNSLKIYRY